jgi:hypothetical protein
MGEPPRHQVRQRNGDPHGMQIHSSDAMIQVLPVDQRVAGPLHSPPLAIERGEPSRTEPLKARHVHPGPPPVRGVPGAERQELQARIPMTPAEADGPTMLEPPPLLAGEGRQAGAHAHRAGEAENERDTPRALCQCGAIGGFDRRADGLRREVGQTAMEGLRRGQASQTQQGGEQRIGELAQLMGPALPCQASTSRTRLSTRVDSPRLRRPDTAPSLGAACRRASGPGAQRGSAAPVRRERVRCA